jgi:hypothetical protein
MELKYSIAQAQASSGKEGERKLLRYIGSEKQVITKVRGKAVNLAVIPGLEKEYGKEIENALLETGLFEMVSKAPKINMKKKTEKKETEIKEEKDEDK